MAFTGESLLKQSLLTLQGCVVVVFRPMFSNFFLLSKTFFYWVDIFCNGNES